MSTPPLHGFDEATEAMAEQIFDYVLDRIRMAPPPLDGPRSATELLPATEGMFTPVGLGHERAFALFRDVLSQACISSDHPRYLAFVPTAPSEAATLFDLVVSASSIYGDWWVEGAGAIHAENETLRWLAARAGLPDGAGGVFVSGGTAGNLAALTTARETWRRTHGRQGQLGIACAPSAHSSIRLAAMVIDIPIVPVTPDERGRLTAPALREAATRAGRDGIDVMAVVATGGATNTGIVDDLAGAAEVAGELGAWFHVDAAYGGAALVSTVGRPLFEGIERADSFVVDPHKWLFVPFDCCALVYRRPHLARAALTQKAEYLETLDATSEWNALRRITFRNDSRHWNTEPDTYPDGIYWGIEYRSTHRTWNLDIWFVTEPERQPDLRHLRELKPKLDDEKRAAILDIKREWFERPEYGTTVTSFDIYTAVLDRGARTSADFEHFIAERQS